MKTWNGSSQLANTLFGERYGIDWEYISKENTDILVNGKIIKIGDLVNPILKDKNGVVIPMESIIYGSLPKEAENHYFNFGVSPNDGSIEMVACTYGYVHNVTQNDVSNMELVGSTKDNLHLLECD